MPAVVSEALGAWNTPHLPAEEGMDWSQNASQAGAGGYCDIIPEEMDVFMGCNGARSQLQMKRGIRH